MQLKRKAVVADQKAAVLTKSVENEAKRPKKGVKTVEPVNEVNKGIALLKKAILNDEYQTSPAIPASVVNMFVSGLPSIFQDYRTERHEYQNAVIELLRAHLGGIQNALDNQLKECAGICDSATGEHQVLEAARDTAKDQRTTATALVQEKKDAVRVEEIPLSQAEKVSKDITKKFGLLAKEHENALAKNSSLRSLYEENFKVLTETSEKTSKQIKKLYDVMEPQLKKMLDTSLFQAAQSALTMNPEERGEFDLLCIKTMDDSFTTSLTESEQKVSDAAAEMKASEEAKATADADIEAAKTRVQVAKAALLEAKTEEKDATRKLVEAEKAVDNHDKATEQGRCDLGAAEKRLEYFADVMKAFNFLDTRDVPVAQIEENAECPDTVVENAAEPTM